MHLRASNAIIDNALLECSMLHDKGAPSLLSVVLHLLRISGHSLDSLSRESATSRNRIPLSVSRSLKTLYEKMFRDHIQESGRLSEIYQFIKKGYGEESYVNNVSNYEHRAVIAKFRISAHFLPIEIGRMQQIPRSQRTCTMCTGSQLSIMRFISYLDALSQGLLKLETSILIIWVIPLVVNGVGWTRKHS